MATSPMLTSLVPGSNPTGANIAIPSMLGPSFTGTNPLYPQILNSSSSSGVGNNPYGVGTEEFNPTPIVPGTSSAVPGGPLPGSPKGGPLGFPDIHGAYGTSGSSGSTGTYVPTGTTADLLQGGGIQPTAATGWSGSEADLVKGLRASGMTRQMASLYAQFLMSGGGYNQNVANALIAQLQPQIERGQENLMEQFSTMGNRFGSGAQIGLADYLSQTNLDVGSILSNLYEQSVQNYMNMLLKTPTTDKTPTNWDIASGVAGMAGNVLSGIMGIL